MEKRKQNVKEIELKLVTKSGKHIKTLLIPSTTTTGGNDLIALVSKSMAMDKNRIKLTIDGASITTMDQLLEHPTTNASISVTFKDLGPQISWKLVFMIEYVGPILIHSFFYLLHNPITTTTWSAIQSNPLLHLSYILVILHFVKREYETMFVHRFSHATMPLLNLPKNCFHYWGLGSWFGYYLYKPTFTYPVLHASTVVVVVVGWIVAQLSNYTTHCILRDLRPINTTKRQIPRGYGFDIVSCPNYLFEIIGWVMYYVLVRDVGVLIFVVIGGLQMMVWAKKKHNRYKKEFTDYPKERNILIPYLF
jgi:very-long-chain enoyl-CoA reductase